MDDLTITRACAESLGWKYLGRLDAEALAKIGQHPCWEGGDDYWKSPDDEVLCSRCNPLPDPLHDDAQAMQLVKRFPKQCVEAVKWAAHAEMLEDDGFDLNRAICEAVAKMQLARSNLEPTPSPAP